jgi:hypothetical protein
MAGEEKVLSDKIGMSTSCPRERKRESFVHSEVEHARLFNGRMFKSVKPDVSYQYEGDSPNRMKTILSTKAKESNQLHFGLRK